MVTMNIFTYFINLIKNKSLSSQSVLIMRTPHQECNWAGVPVLPFWTQDPLCSSQLLMDGSQPMTEHDSLFLRETGCFWGWHWPLVDTGDLLPLSPSRRIRFALADFYRLLHIFPHLGFANKTPFILFMGFSRQEYWSDLSFPSPVDHILSDISTMTHPSWVAPHGMA